jgi:fumarate hydratase class II
MEYRIEHDSMGEVRVPADRYWGAQTQRSHEIFPEDAKAGGAAVVSTGRSDYILPKAFDPRVKDAIARATAEAARASGVARI